MFHLDIYNSLIRRFIWVRTFTASDPFSLNSTTSQESFLGNLNAGKTYALTQFRNILSGIVTTGVFLGTVQPLLAEQPVQIFASSAIDEFTTILDEYAELKSSSELSSLCSDLKIECGDHAQYWGLIVQEPIGLIIDVEGNHIYSFTFVSSLEMLAQYDLAGRTFQFEYSIEKNISTEACGSIREKSWLTLTVGNESGTAYSEEFFPTCDGGHSLDPETGLTGSSYFKIISNSNVSFISESTNDD